MNVTMTAHAKRTIEAKGFDMKTVLEVWKDPDTTYPSFRHPGQHKRIGRGICLCCDDRTGMIITIFIDQVKTDLRRDQRFDADAVRWAKKNGMRVK